MDEEGIEASCSKSRGASRKNHGPIREGIGQVSAPSVCEIGARRKAMLDASKSLWATYSTRKAEWLAEHPEADPNEIAAACRAIADELGL